MFVCQVMLAYALDAVAFEVNVVVSLSWGMAVYVAFLVVLVSVRIVAFLVWNVVLPDVVVFEVNAVAYAVVPPS